MFAGEGSPTFSALKRPFSSANSLVSNECGTVPKEFSTLTTTVSSFFSVDFLVTNKLGRSKEGCTQKALALCEFSGGH